jgi:hypothetical protein
MLSARGSPGELYRPGELERLLLGKSMIFRCSLAPDDAVGRVAVGHRQLNSFGGRPPRGQRSDTGWRMR